MTPPKVWLLAAILALAGIASSASVPQGIIVKRQTLEQGSSVSVPEVSDATAQVVSMDESKAQEMLSTTGRPEVDITPNLENSVVIHTKTSKVVIPVERNPSLSTLREERVFLVFPEANTATAATELVTEETPEVTEARSETEILTSAPNTDEETSIRFGAQEEADKNAEESIIFPNAAFRSEEPNTSSTTPEEPLSSTTTSTAADQTTEASSTTSASTTVETSTCNNEVTSTSPAAPSTATRRAYRGTPRTTKKGTKSTTTPGPSTTTEEIGNLTSSTTEENSSKSQESDEETESVDTTTHKIPHFDVTKAPVLRPAPKPSPRLVAFLKKRPGGITKKLNSHTDSEDSLTSTSTTTTTTTTTSTTSAPETTTKFRRGNIFGARNRPKMLDRSSSEPEEVTVTPPNSVLERRRARFYSSASSMLSGFVPSVPLPRVSTGEMYIRNSRRACADPAGCINPKDAEVIMAALQKNDTSALTQAQTPVSETTNAIRSRMRSRRPQNSSSRSRTTVAPTTTTVEVMRSAAQRLAQRRRTTKTSTTTPTTTTTSTTTTPMPSVITMKQIQEIVVSPAPITVADAVIGIMPQQPRLIQEPLATSSPPFQRFNRFENKPVQFVQAKVPSHYGQHPLIHRQFMHSAN